MYQALEGASNCDQARHRPRTIALLISMVTVGALVVAMTATTMASANAATVAAPKTTTTTTIKITTTTTVKATTAKTTTTKTTPTTTTTTTAPPPPVADNCSTDVSALLTARLAALPSGAVFTAPQGACYQVDEGVVISHPLTLVGGTFKDETTSTTPRGGGRFHPVIQILDTSDVTLSGLTIEGTNSNGIYHPLLVGEAGVKVLSSSDVTLDGITVSDTFGDGLELVADLGHTARPDTNLTVNGYTTTNAGRQGMTFAEVEGATLTNVHIVSPADSGFDFESDITNLGSGDVSINDCTYQHGLNVVEPLKGPLALTNCSGGSYLWIQDGRTKEPVSLSGGTLRCEVRSPVPCIILAGGRLTLSHMAVTRHATKEVMTERAWHIFNGAVLSLIDTSVAGPLGTKDATSTVAVSS